MNIPLYTLWTDTMFYVYLAAFFASLVALIYSIRGYLELANATPYADELADAPLVYSEPAATAEAEELPLREAEQPEPEPLREEPLPQEEPVPQAAPAQDSEKTIVVSNIEEMISQSMEAAGDLETDAGEAPQEEAPAPAPVELPAQEQALPSSHASKAEEFVKGIYENISRINGRLDAIEGSISKTNGEFALKFLEDMMTDYDTLNKDKIRARIQFLISDLKK